MEVTLIAAQSLDGYIAQHDIPGTGFTSPADKRHFRSVLADFDTSVFGAGTYRVSRDYIRPQLSTARRRIVLTRSPHRFATDSVPGQLEFTSETPRQVVDRLRTEGSRRCALLGGGQIHRLFLDAGLVDRLLITLEPRLFGEGTPLVDGRVDTRLELEDVRRLPESDSLLVAYRVRR